MTSKYLRMSAIAALFAAGIIHLWLAPEHYEHSPVHALFFVIAGILEIGWAILYWRKPSPLLTSAGLMLSGGLVVLWGLTRLVRPPFESSPAPVDFSGVLCKLCELVGFTALLYLAIRSSEERSPDRPAICTVAAATLLAVLGAALVFGGGLAMENLFPSLSADEHGLDAHHDYGGDEMEHGHSADDEVGTSRGTETIASVNGFQISKAWARAGLAGGNSAVYFRLNNPTPNQDRLVEAASPVAQSVEMHLSEVDANGVARMRPQESVEIPAGWQVTFEPGGLHIMLVGLLEDLKPGEVFTLTLVFENAGNVDVQVPVQAP